MFQYLYGLNSPCVFKYSDNMETLTIADKGTAKMIRLNIEYGKLEKKFYTWRDSKEKTSTLLLDLEETSVFIEVCNAAYYHIQKDKNASKVHLAGIELIYKMLFGKLKLNMPVQ